VSKTLRIGSIYKHYKGKRYKILGVARHSETLEELALYECLYENDLGKIWVRPLEMFRGVLEDGRKRFELETEA
jgi:hypothetical protein